MNAPLFVFTRAENLLKARSSRVADVFRNGHESFNRIFSWISELIYYNCNCMMIL